MSTLIKRAMERGDIRLKSFHRVKTLDQFLCSVERLRRVWIDELDVFVTVLKANFRQDEAFFRKRYSFWIRFVIRIDEDMFCFHGKDSMQLASTITHVLALPDPEPDDSMQNATQS
jgi:hypothetical protein